MRSVGGRLFLSYLAVVVVGLSPADGVAPEPAPINIQWYVVTFGSGVKVQRGEITADEEKLRLRAVETELDQCWDLLRQRRALRETGGDPTEAHVRPADQVEGYLN